MAFSGTFQQGLSGLNAAQRGLEVISNNVANANVVGFKGSEAQFADVFARSFSGASSGTGIGLGTSLSSVTQNFKQGALSVTGNPLDMAISGAGFFKVKAENGDHIYTRNGQFNIDNDGNIINSSGQKLQGFKVDDATGRVGDVSGDIQIPQGAVPPEATTTTSLDLNLDARAVPVSAAITFDPANLNSYTNSTAMTVYDELGNSHNMAIYMRKESSSNWSVYASVDGTQVDVGVSPVTATTAPAQSGAGTLAFGVDGKLTTPANASFTVDLSRYVTAAGVPFSSVGASPNAYTFDMTASTQFGSSFSIQNLAQDGYTASPFSGFDVGADGTISVNYTNGESISLAKVGLFKFTNPGALQPVGSNGWMKTEAAGPELVSLSEDTAFGLIRSGALEDANVDLTAELVAMISAQRVYQANSQSIKTQDSLLQTITNLR